MPSLRALADPVQQFGALLRSAATREHSARADHAALSELEVSDHSALGLPPGLSLRWLGTAGYALSYEGHCVLIDPYVTRLPLSDFLQRRVVRPDRDVIEANLPTADAVLIGHTHFDHALDAPAVAVRDDCPVYGSESVGTLMRLYHRADQAVVVEPYRVYEIGPFEVTFVPSLHAKLLLGLRVNQAGPITCEHLEGLTPQAYCCDQVWAIHIAVAGVSFYHQGSADLIEDAIRHEQVDYFLCGIAGRQFTPAYVERALRKLEPRIVIPNHYDNFFSPLTAPLEFTLGVDVDGFRDEVAAVSADFDVRALGLL